LEKTLRSFSCLTTGDSIMVAYNNKNYYIDIIETKPSPAISIIETDCEVDFAPPLDYKEPQPVRKPTDLVGPSGMVCQYHAGRTLVALDVCIQMVTTIYYYFFLYI
jgi:Ubiquitin fusion degradation protein UFD1